MAERILLLAFAIALCAATAAALVVMFDSF
jgi:hypothetical protein